MFVKYLLCVIIMLILMFMMKIKFVISSDSDRPREEYGKLIYKETEAQRLNVLLTIWRLVNDTVTNKIFIVSSLFQSSLCCPTYPSLLSTHIVDIYIKLLFMISLSYFLVPACFFSWMLCNVTDGNMLCDSGGLIFISLANVATSRYHFKPFIFTVTNDRFACLFFFFQEEKWKEKLRCCPDVGSVTWCLEESGSQET